MVVRVLGVLLYELLTGTTPFAEKELLTAGLDEMLRNPPGEPGAVPQAATW